MTFLQRRRAAGEPQTCCDRGRYPDLSERDGRPRHRARAARPARVRGERPARHRPRPRRHGQDPARRGLGRASGT